MSSTSAQPKPISSIVPRQSGQRTGRARRGWSFGLDKAGASAAPAEWRMERELTEQVLQQLREAGL